MPYKLQLYIAQQTAQGIHFLHSSSPPIIHANLKSRNVLLDSLWNARISNFGLSEFKVTTSLLPLPPILLSFSSFFFFFTFFVRIVSHLVMFRHSPSDPSCRGGTLGLFIGWPLRYLMDRRRPRRVTVCIGETNSYFFSSPLCLSFPPTWMKSVAIGLSLPRLMLTFD